MKHYRDAEKAFHQYVILMEEVGRLGIVQKNSNNPLFNLRKMLPEQSQDLLFLESSLKRLKLIKNILVFPVSFFANSFHSFILNTFREFDKRQLSFENSQQDYVLLSHMELSRPEQSVTDNFLAVFSQFDRIKDNSATIYLSHESWRNKRKEVNEDGRVPEVHRSINQGKFLQILFINSIKALRILMVSISAKGLSLNARLLLSVASMRQLQRSCIYDEIISENCVRYVNALNPKVFVLTFEGHTFEISTIKKLQQTFPSLNVIAYQHAPIVNSQYGFFRGLNFFSANAYLLTTGEIPREIVVSKVSKIIENVRVLGTAKNLNTDLGDLKSEPHASSRLLLAPEASMTATNELLRISKEMALEHNLSFFMRLHPRLNFPEFENQLSINFPSVTLSTEKSLISELALSKACFYRSSAVGIQSMLFGVMPIFTSDQSRELLDPVYAFLKLPKYENLKSALIESKDFNRDLAFSEETKARVQEVGQRYFSKVDEETLRWITNL
jgi:hypothetical protein